MSARLEPAEFEDRAFMSEGPFLLSALPEVAEAAAETEAGPGFEVDPYAGIRSALSTEHATLPPDRLAIALGRQPAVVALHHMLMSLEPQQAVLSVLLGRAGRRSMRLSGSDVPIPAYLRILSRLCHEVAEEIDHETTGFVPEAEATDWPREGSIVAEQEITQPFAFESPQCVNTRHFISGFPEYGVTVVQLGTDQRAVLEKIVAEIVDSAATNMPVVAILVVGHADVALRKPLSERDAFEHSISTQRADNALTMILDGVQRRAGSSGRSIVSGIQTRTMGVGSTQPMVARPTTEPQRRLNRRVEILLAHCTLPPAPAKWTWREAARRGLSLLRPDTEAHARIMCMLTLLLNVPDAKDGYFDYQKYRHLWFPPGTTEQQKAKLLSDSLSHLEGDATKGGLANRANFGPPDEVGDGDFVKGLETIDEVIARSMRDFRLNAEAGGIGASDLIVRAWKVIQLSRTDPKSVYSCYASYHW